MLQRLPDYGGQTPESSPPRAINGDERVSDEIFRNYEHKARQSRGHGKPRGISAESHEIARVLSRMPRLIRRYDEASAKANQSLQAGEFRQQPRMRAYTVMKARLLELLVGAVYPVIVQAEPHQQRIHA
jgi:hypothetical protein